MPKRRACTGEVRCNGAPRRVREPLSGRVIPVRTHPRVLFPLPLAPSSATTSPALMEISACSSARTAPYRLATPEATRVALDLRASRGSVLLPVRRDCSVKIRAPFRSGHSEPQRGIGPKLLKITVGQRARRPAENVTAYFMYAAASSCVMIPSKAYESGRPVDSRRCVASVS